MSDRLRIAGLSEAACAALARSRVYEQYVRGVRDALTDRCPFCQLDPSYNHVCCENEYWMAWQSPSPLAHTTHHLVVVPRRHVMGMDELVDETEGAAFLAIMRQLRGMHGIKSSGLLCRDGNATLSAGTIEHLHWHLIVPDGKGRVETPFYKGPESDNEAHARALVFERLRTGTPIEDLTADERQRVEGRL